jgi:NAD(P)-dependent dehydrogenase (short-subunit alcohol dehydrogenase family)
MREEDLQEVITTNLMAPLVFAREVSKSFLKRKVSEGNIIMIGSIIADQGNVGQTVYAASKAGLSGAVKSLALELGSRNIRTNLISPGYIKTDMTASIKSLEGRPEVLPEEVAEAVRFVLRTKSLNGESITVDGVTPFQDTIRSSLQKL